MYSAFDSQYAHIPGPAYCPQRKPSPRFLSSVKSLIKRPSRTRLEVPPVDSQALPSRSSAECSRQSRERSRSPVPRVEAHSWEAPFRNENTRRENIPSMIDYLTLAQLENVWYKQDTYRGCVSMPQTAPSPELEYWQRQESSRTSERIYPSPSLGRHPAFRVRRRSFDEPVRSRPPSYRS